MEYNKVKVLDKRNDFLEVMEIDFELAASLNVGDSINPYGTGFAFIVVDKLLVLSEENKQYELRINVKEYQTMMDKIYKIFGITRCGYWDYFKNNRIQSWT